MRSIRVDSEKMFEVLTDLELFEDKPTGLVVYELREIRDILHWTRLGVWILALGLISAGIGICTVSIEGA